MNAHQESPLIFECEGAHLLGVLHAGSASATCGMLIVVGGPQYRVGSHRQFVLLARDLAQAGIPVLRFDYRGMGDSEGEFAGFEQIDADIAVAVDAFFAQIPGLREVVIWGLCDAASAALFYAWRDPRITGLVLLNPWLRTEAGQARAYLRHYYLARLINPDLWRKIGRGEFSFATALRSLLALVGQVWRGERGGSQSVVETATAVQTSEPNQPPLPERMADGLRRFKGRALLILSGDDLTAAEFRDTVKASRRWRRLLAQPRVTIREYPAANHTFSCREWRDQVAAWTREWLRKW
ncbi:hydrolase 1, exosortase A system-associated [Candidatus Contendibacter odensensis]|uniref:Hydrolase, exosortase system type 1 associated n=1 Tax=Candidatus Contendobacter odensis Run_B_J11 TaxID=1400861 RepID=A0A7U7G7V7_9GAMM|nr:hydrolase 1, exosortase A system-associated [Candidatus Contendobacter odensis]CDH43541.1 Hydrolase, exosortase system type 1 associated [Candidatus Contendobacter odensis Run_B_J11]